MSQDKILPSVTALADVVASLKDRGKSVIQCHGVFDLLHIGHIRHFYGIDPTKPKSFAPS